MVTLCATLIYSLFVNISGALTTLQIPPSVESDSLKYPKPTFIYNYQMILDGNSSSFIYNNFAKGLIDLKYYALLIGIIVLGVTLIMLSNVNKVNNKKP